MYFIAAGIIHKMKEKSDSKNLPIPMQSQTYS